MSQAVSSSIVHERHGPEAVEDMALTKPRLVGSRHHPHRNSGSDQKPLVGLDPRELGIIQIEPHPSEIRPTLMFHVKHTP